MAGAPSVHIPQRLPQSRPSASKNSVDVAISPSVTLDELLTSRELCCLDDFVGQYERKHTRNGSSFPKSRSNSEIVHEILKNHVFNISDCSFYDGYNKGKNDKEEEGKDNRRSRSKHLMEWATVFSDISNFFSRGTTRQSSATGELTWNNYYRYDSIMQFAKNLANSSQYVGYIQTGFSHEGRELFALAFATNISSVLQRYARKSTAADSLLARGGPRLQQRRSRANVKVKDGESQDFKRSSKVKVRPKKESHSIDEKERKKKKGKNKGVEEEREKVKKEKKKKKITSREKKKKKKQMDRQRRKSKKPVLLIEAGTHAREWISPAVATYLAQQFALAGKFFLRHLTVILVLVANPDGYEYTHVYDRMWRKNRRAGSGMDGCIGVDLNRNWNISWGDEDGTSTDPCSFQYCGDRAFSEPETSAIRNLTAVYLQNMHVFISLHSYGQYLLHPWGHSVKKPPKYGKLKSMGKLLLKALNSNDYAYYTAGQSSWILYQSSGTADDYMYSLGVPYSYTLELPGTDSFELPASQILPTAEDIWSSLVCFLGEVIGTKRAKSFCYKRIVTVTTENNVTVSTWVDKVVPTATAKAILLTNFRRKNRNTG